MCPFLFAETIFLKSVSTIIANEDYAVGSGGATFINVLHASFSCKIFGAKILYKKRAKFCTKNVRVKLVKFTRGEHKWTIILYDETNKTMCQSNDLKYEQKISIS